MNCDIHQRQLCIIINYHLRFLDLIRDDCPVIVDLKDTMIAGVPIIIEKWRC